MHFPQVCLATKVIYRGVLSSGRVQIDLWYKGLRVSFSSCQRNLIKIFQIEAMIALIKKKGINFFMRLVKWPKIDVKKCQNLIFKVDFQCQKSFESF